MRITMLQVITKLFRTFTKFSSFKNQLYGKENNFQCLRGNTNKI